MWSAESPIVSKTLSEDFIRSNYFHKNIEMPFAFCTVLTSALMVESNGGKNHEYQIEIIHPCTLQCQALSLKKRKKKEEEKEKKMFTLECS